jgi:hypothetical protein
MLGCASSVRRAFNLPGTVRYETAVSDIRKYMDLKTDTLLSQGRNNTYDTLHIGFLVYPADSTTIPYEAIFVKYHTKKSKNLIKDFFSAIEDSNNIGVDFFFHPMIWTQPDILKVLNRLPKVKLELSKNSSLLHVTDTSNLVFPCKSIYVSKTVIYADIEKILPEDTSYKEDHEIIIKYKNKSKKLQYSYSWDTHSFGYPRSIASPIFKK